jgi:hypothetical protein
MRNRSVAFAGISPFIGFLVTYAQFFQVGYARSYAFPLFPYAPAQSGLCPFFYPLQCLFCICVGEVVDPSSCDLHLLAYARAYLAVFAVPKAEAQQVAV